MLKLSPDIEKCQLPNNDAKNLIGMESIEVLIFIYPKRKAYCRVLRVSSAKSWVSSTEIQLEHLNLS